jgi:hypothetical protein
MKTILFRISIWHVVARTGLLGGQTVAVTLHFMSIYFVGRLGDEEVKVHYSLVGCDPVCEQPSGFNCMKNVLNSWLQYYIFFNENPTARNGILL